MAIRSLLTSVLFIILAGGAAMAEQVVLSVQSVTVPPYEAAVSGFKAVSQFETKRIVLSEMGGMDVNKKIKQIRPRLILALGMDALSTVKVIRNVPVFYLMVLNPTSVLQGQNNISGISMIIPAERQLKLFSAVLPDLRKVGCIFDPEDSGNFVKKAREAAAKMGIEFFATEVLSAKDISPSIEDMAGKIDAFWMLPDRSVIKQEAIEFLVLFSIETKIPIITFSEKYVEMGALMSISTDPSLLGCQAGRMTNAILGGTDPLQTKPIDPIDVSVSINMKIVKKLNVTVDEKAIQKAKVID
ncbi:conserved exported hypothetical protein [uncultured Desulfobacterium sp.]|uniref:ABC transporter substrate binding protein n=1 Tax=uncultured Desulfobacterium sp. TaxID=201089 RepID=A0A445MXM7_9BACT|nr:conserved exported hypothetical protein [uncultured Desulfobacterium sp.]